MEKELLEVRIAPLGEYPQGGAVQVVDAGALAELTGEFGRRARWRWLAGTVPVFLGHPDAAGGKGDPRPLGTVEAVEARADGLYGRLRLDAGRRRRAEALEGPLHASPHWRLRALGPGRWRPFRLLSVGLTATPNLPGTRLGGGGPEGVERPALPGRHPALATAPGRAARAAAVEARMAATGEDYAAAWAALKRGR